MGVASEQGCFVIADLSGYTGYLTGSELDHAQDVLADLMETVIGRMQPVLRLAKLEGDAIFTFAPMGTIDGSLVLDLVEDAYFAFQRRLRSIRQATTCQCNACRTIPGLNLKFMVHNGAFIRQRIMGQEELAGRDVILVHRLLKNSVTERLGLHGYALLTADCIRTMGLDVEALGLIPHQETYEHIGDVAVYVHDLQARWRQEQEARRMRVTPEEADVGYEAVFDAPPALAWEWTTDAARRPQVTDDILRAGSTTLGGRRGVGTMTHCVHGDQSEHIEEVVDWHPFEYFTYLIRDPQMGDALVTESFEPLEGDARTRYRWDMRIQSPEARAMMADPQHAPKFEELRKWLDDHFTEWMRGLTGRLNEEMARRAEDVETSEDARKRLRETAQHYWEARDWVEQATATP